MTMDVMKIRHPHHAFSGNTRRYFLAHDEGKFGREDEFCKSLTSDLEWIVQHPPKKT
jgi:hypothetical protein